MQEIIKSIEKQVVSAESDGATATIPPAGMKSDHAGADTVREIVEELDENDNVICKSQGIAGLWG